MAGKDNLSIVVPDHESPATLSADHQAAPVERGVRVADCASDWATKIMTPTRNPAGVPPSNSDSDDARILAEALADVTPLSEESRQRLIVRSRHDCPDIHQGPVKLVDPDQANSRILHVDDHVNS